MYVAMPGRWRAGAGKTHHKRTWIDAYMKFRPALDCHMVLKSIFAPTASTIAPARRFRYWVSDRQGLQSTAYAMYALICSFQMLSLKLEDLRHHTTTSALHG